MSVLENILDIKQKIAAAAEKSGRKAEDITLLAVTKTKPVSLIKEAVDAGLSELGENRVQELMEKYPELEGVKWHLIGHLQTNKVKYIVDKVSLIHSVDSLRLAEEINKRAASPVDILVEVNIGGEEQKYGVAPEAAEELIRDISVLPNVRVRGLMTVAPIMDSRDELKLLFRKMKELFVDISEKRIDNVNMEILSMGMTDDYEPAIEEGSNLVRIGTGIFGARG